MTYDHHLIKGSRGITLDKSTSTEIYSMLILRVQNKPSFNIYFKILFNHDHIDEATIYVLPRQVTHDTYMRSFHYKILNNILYPILYLMGQNTISHIL